MFAVQPQPAHMMAPEPVIVMQRVRTPYGWISMPVEQPQQQPEPQPTHFSHRRQLSAISQQWQEQQNMMMMGGLDTPMETVDVAMDMEMSTPIQQRVFEQISNNKRKRAEDDQPMFRSEGKVRRIASMRGTPSHQAQQNFFATSPFQQQQSPFQQSPFQASPFQQASPFGTPSNQMYQMSCRTCHSAPQSYKLLNAYISCSICNSWTCNICARMCSTWDCRFNGDTICSSCAREDQNGDACCHECQR